MRYKVIVAYDGSKYKGWQTQKRGDSVQEHIEAVLNIIHHRSISIHASGRTDSGVHALGQVFHFDSTLNMKEQQFKKAMNALLDSSIRIQAVKLVNDDFHARFDCSGKKYCYILSKEVDDPFVEAYKTLDASSLNGVEMKEAANCFLGTHDFTSFTSTRVDPNKDKIRTIYALDIIEFPQETHFIFEGSGFLRYMIRMMVGTLVMVGKEKIKVQDVKAILDGASKELCTYKAPPNGLYLVEVSYKEKTDEDELSYTHDTLSPCSW